MKILVDGQVIIASGAEMTLGESDESFDKWSVFGKNGEFKYYCIDRGYEVIEVEEPEGYRDDIFSYIDGELVKTGDWVKYITPEERLNYLEAENERLTNENLDSIEIEAELLFELSMLSIGI